MKYLRILLLVLLAVALFALWQFPREILYHLKTFYIPVLKSAIGSSIIGFLGKLLGLRLAEAHWLAYATHRVALLSVAIGILHVYFFRTRLTLLAIGITAAAIIGCLLLNILAGRFQLTALDIAVSSSLEIIFSPLMLFFLITLLKLKNDADQKAVQN